MGKAMQYKGFMGSIEFSQEDGVFYGKVQGIKALVSYEGTTVDELEKDFQEAIESYLELCMDNKVSEKRC